MMKLLVAASLAASLAVGAMPAFAQSATTTQQNWTASADNGMASSVQAQNYTLAPNYDPPAATTEGAHIGNGSSSNYEQQELAHLPGYSPDSP
jgi:hypothetical protein